MSAVDSWRYTPLLAEMLESLTERFAQVAASYYRHADGSYYFPDRASEEHGLATPRDPRTLGWLPTGWSDPVSLAGEIRYTRSPPITTAPAPRRAAASQRTSGSARYVTHASCLPTASRS